MKLKEHCDIWPPIVTIGKGAFGADLADKVLNLRRLAEGNDCLVLITHDKDTKEYFIPVLLPPDVLDKAALFLVPKLPLTLAQVGELDI